MIEVIVFDIEVLNADVTRIIFEVVKNVLPFTFLVGLTSFAWKTVYNGLRSMLF